MAVPAVLRLWAWLFPRMKWILRNREWNISEPHHGFNSRVNRRHVPQVQAQGGPADPGYRRPGARQFPRRRLPHRTMHPSPGSWPLRAASAQTSVRIARHGSRDGSLARRQIQAPMISATGIRTGRSMYPPFALHSTPYPPTSLSHAPIGWRVAWLEPLHNEAAVPIAGFGMSFQCIV